MANIPRVYHKLPYCTNLIIANLPDLERQQHPPDTEPPHAAAIKLLEIVSALVSSPAILPQSSSGGARHFIELENQSIRG